MKYSIDLYDLFVYMLYILFVFNIHWVYICIYHILFSLHIICCALHRSFKLSYICFAGVVYFGSISILNSMYHMFQFRVS